MFQHILSIRTKGRGLLPITDQVTGLVQQAAVVTGLCNLFIRHTSASLLISENADPAVGRDLERFMQRTAADGSTYFEHDAEGPDDMAAHIRSMLAGVTMNVPIGGGELLLGTWQGIYLWEHRLHGHTREVVVTISDR